MVTKCFVFFATSVILISQRTCGFSCGCRCRNGREVCDDLNRLVTSVDVVTADLKKWNEHYRFLKHFHHEWKSEIMQICQDQISEKEEQRSENLEYRSMRLNNQDETINSAKIASELLVRIRELESRATGTEAKLLKMKERITKSETDIQSAQEAMMKIERKQNILSMSYQNYRNGSRIKRKELENLFSSTTADIRAVQSRLEQLEEGEEVDKKWRKNMEAKVSDLKSLAKLFPLFTKTKTMPKISSYGAQIGNYNMNKPPKKFLTNLRSEPSSTR